MAADEPQVDVVDETAPYDPAEHNVDEVLEHLEDVHPDEVARILAAEEAGQGRKTILGSRFAAEAEQTEPATVEELLGDANPYELVRARTTGEEPVEYTTTRIAALNAGSTVLEKPAADQFGIAYPTKPVLDLSGETTPTDAAADQPGLTPEEN